MKKYFFLTLTVLCVAFIYVNSLMNARISTEQSSFVVKVIKEAVAAVGISPAVITEYMIRKTAHFCEYALFGFLITSTIHAWRDKIKAHTYMLLFWCLLIPVSDESLQLFVDGRAGMVQDVMLDFAGSIFGILIYVGISSLLHLYGKRKQQASFREGEYCSIGR